VVALSLGTSGVIFATTEEPLSDPRGQVHAFCHGVPDRWHLMTVMLSAAGSLRWFRDTLAPGEEFGALATSAGEALPVELYERWTKTFGVELLDGLGTAEMWHIFISNKPGAVKPGTLGTVVPGFDVRVRDDLGHDLPDGEVGMLWVRGGSRATCYWQQMEKTQAAFRGEWYVSGDLVRRDRDGYFTYCGRADELLKVGGRWLAPQEVEGCLLQHPLVREVAVVGIEDASGLTKPHAFVVATEQRPGLEEELQTFARERLEPYKAPRTVRFLDVLPRTHLGKVDRGKLRLQ
jgi:acyl-coenzyme A synthetase/AMP-(fatty) acid ligase